MANNEYKVEGSEKRKMGYTLGIVVAALVLAGLIAGSIITMEQITGFADVWVELITVLTTLGWGISSLVARKNVEPPVEIDFVNHQI